MSDSKKTGTRVFQKKSTPKLSADTKCILEFTGQQKFPKREAFVVAIAAPSGVVQMTFHHPIGFTQLSDEEWIATETSQIHFLFERVTHPGKKTYDQEIFIAKLKAMAVDGLLVEKDDDYYYPGHTDKGSRKVLVGQARAKAKAATDDKKSSADSYIPFLEEPLQALELSYLAKFRKDSTQKLAEGEVTLPKFETKGGLQADTPQEPIAFLKGKTIDEARTRIFNKILS